MSETQVSAIPNPGIAQALAEEIIGDRADVDKAVIDIDARIKALRHTIRMCEAEIAVMEQAKK